MTPWFCAAHHLWTTGDCPRCDDELIALAAALTEDPSREGCAVIADGSKRTLTPLACKGSISGAAEDPS